MPIGTKLVGDKIRDTLTNELQQEDWTQMPLKSKGLELPPPSPLKTIFFVDKGFATPLPPNKEEEKVQKGEEEEPQQIAIDDVSGEGQMVAYPQQASHNTKVRTMGSIEIETTKDEPS